VNSKFFNNENIETIFMDKIDDKTHEEKEILKAYKLISDKINSKAIFKWKWSRKLKPEESIYEEGDDGFEELKKCEQMKLVIKKNNR
jgi:hypothetical protein